MQRLPAITHARFSLIRFRSPLLTESLLFSLPDGTEMFHFPSFPLTTLYIQVRVTGNDSSRVTPFGNPRITARLPAPRGLSQAPTSFIGSWCQDIHRMPLKTYDTHPDIHLECARKNAQIKMLTSTIQFTSNEHTQPTDTPVTPPSTVTGQPRDTLMQGLSCQSKTHSRGTFPSSRPTGIYPDGPLPQDPTAHRRPQPRERLTTDVPP